MRWVVFASTTNSTSRLSLAGRNTPRQHRPCDDSGNFRAGARTRRLLEAPVLSTLLWLSAPNLVEAAARVTFLTDDAAFVSWLGADSLAAVAIVFRSGSSFRPRQHRALAPGFASARLSGRGSTLEPAGSRARP